MSRGAALTGALLATLATPATWPLALAAFLLRGGLLLVVIPIVVLPSPVGLGNLLGPTLVTVVLSGVSVEVAAIVALVAAAILAWVVFGGLLAATLEAEAARIVEGAGDGNAARNGDGAGGAGFVVATRPAVEPAAARILAVRAVAHIPTALALIWGSARLVALTYRELTTPAEVRSPIAVRVLHGAPEVIAVIVVLWMLGEILGGIAARRVALGGASVKGALRDASITIVRHPVSMLVDFWVPTIGLALVVIPSAMAATVAWGTVRVAIRSPTDVFAATLAVLLFVTLWMVGLLLIAVTTAWRAAVWSLAHRETGP